MPSRLHLRLDAARDLSPSVRHLVFSVEGAPAVYQAGQCVNLHVPAEGDVFQRPYSIACAPQVHGGKRIELLVTRVPEGFISHALHRLPSGAELETDPPRGHLIRNDKDEPALFVGTGSGLGPLRAMIQEELSRERGPRIGLLFGCRTERDILWADELQGWARHHPRFSLFVTLSRAGGAWGGRRGYVQAHLGDALAQVQPTRVFICGLSAMTTSVEDALREAGFPRSGVLLEEYDA